MQCAMLFLYSFIFLFFAFFYILFTENETSIFATEQSTTMPHLRYSNNRKSSAIRKLSGYFVFVVLLIVYVFKLVHYQNKQKRENGLVLVKREWLISVVGVGSENFP